MHSIGLLTTVDRKSRSLTRSIRDSETSIDLVQGPPGSRRERVNKEKQATSSNNQHITMGKNWEQKYLFM